MGFNEYMMGLAAEAEIERQRAAAETRRMQAAQRLAEHFAGGGGADVSKPVRELGASVLRQVTEDAMVFIDPNADTMEMPVITVLPPAEDHGWSEDEQPSPRGDWEILGSEPLEDGDAIAL